MGEFTKQIQLTTNVTINQVIELKAIKFLPTDSIGNRQYDKPAFEMK
jgi:hypothetical protein